MFPGQLLHWLSWSGHQFGNRDGVGQKALGYAQTTPSNDVLQRKNFAAWIPSEKSQLKVGKAPFPKCGDDELIIKNHVVAVNPVDWKIQSWAGFNLTYPTILGEDVAGEVVEVGSKLKDKFEVGQRVMAYTLGMSKGSAYGGFQLYPVLTAATTSLIPDEISFVDAAVLPLSVSTAAAGLFMNDTLGLDYPKLDSSFPKSFMRTRNIPTLLVWGGSSSVGSSVIQLASAAGYAVVTTSSPSHYRYCKNLGAAHVLDYHDPDVVSSLISLLKGKKIVGSYDAIGSDETVRQSAAVLHALGGGKIASVGSAPEDLPKDVTVARMSAGNIVTKEPEVANLIWGEYVLAALKSGKLVPSPKPLLVGNGLEVVQKGLDRQKQGVNARKVEIVLE
jgi:NADPH:quinone reductase-like Zn-dependent oxidoreductase